MRFILFAMLLFFTGAAQAAESSPVQSFLDAPKLNRQVMMSREDFEAKTVPMQETPLGNKYLAFKIRLPKGWARLDVPQGKGGQRELSKGILGDISQYLGPSVLDVRSSFRLRANELPFDISARDWFLNYMMVNNYNLQGLDLSSEKRAQAQYVKLEGGHQYVVRATAQINGQRVILAEYIVPIEAWEAEKDMAKMAMASFVLKNEDPGTVELMNDYSFVDIAKFEFQNSWFLNAPPISSIERMGASIINLKGGNSRKSNFRDQNNDMLLMDGRVDLSIVTKSKDTTLKEEVQDLKDQMRQRGLVLGDYIETAEGWKHHKAITFSKIEAYKINNERNKLADYEQWIGVFETPRRYYFVRLLTLGRHDNFLIWARNMKTYKTVIETLAPVE